MTATTVTVLGMGPMGLAVGGALLRGGVDTTIWTRSGREDPALAKEGARFASTAAEAVTASDLVIVALRDHEAVREVLGSIDPASFDDRTVLTVASSTPSDARRTAEWATERGIRYLSAAIMVPTPVIGTEDALILYSGPEHAFGAHRDTLALIAGQNDYLGDDHGLASLFDSGMLTVFFAGMTAFLQALATVEAQGVSPERFVGYGSRMTAYLPDTFVGLARDVANGTYPGDEDRLSMELASLEHVVHTTAESGVDAGLTEVMVRFVRAAVEAGHGDDGFSRIVDVLRLPLAHPARMD